MRWLAKIILLLTGWRVISDFPNIPKSIVASAPHTSAWDAFFCKVAMAYWGVPHCFLIKKDWFRFPWSVAMRVMHAYPVGIEGQNLIHDMAQLLERSKAMHIVICPEGTRKACSQWNPGFYVMAKRSGVPITVFRMDYERKVMEMVGTVPQDNARDTLARLAEIYRGVHACHPEQFLLPDVTKK